MHFLKQQVGNGDKGGRHRNDHGRRNHGVAAERIENDDKPGREDKAQQP